MIIVLIGYMGSGKSTIGKQLSKVLDYSFIDLDEYISKNENSTIPNLFKTKGEIYFRRVETKYLKTTLETTKNVVLSLGGGTPCYSGNLELIKANKSIKSFYLKLSIPALVNRLKKEKDSRPILHHLTTEDDLTEFIGKHLFERMPFYSKANHTINCDDKSVAELVEEILMQLI